MFELAQDFLELVGLTAAAELDQTALILRTIAAFEVFAVVVALGGTTLPVLVGETFNWQFALNDRNVAAAFALVILAISIAATLVFLRVLRTPKGATI